MSQLITMIHLSNEALIEHYHSRLPSNLQGAEHKPYWCVSATEEKLWPLEDGEVAPEYTVNRLAMVDSGTEEEATFALPEVDLTDGNVYEMPLGMFRLFKAKAGVFDAPEPEPEPEPRYKGTTLDNMLSVEEFARDLITKAEWFAIEEVAKLDSTVGMARDITLAGPVLVTHEDFVTFMHLGVAKGVWTQERANEISKGLLIQ